MADHIKTIARSLANGDYIEVTAERRAPSDSRPLTLSPGFAITCSIWEARPNAKGRTRKRQGRDSDAGGAAHDDILRAFPKLAPLVAVHLADLDGTPMYAKANGWYLYSGKAREHAERMVAGGHDYGYSRELKMDDHTRAASALHIDPEELPKGIASREEFDAYVDSLADHYAAQAAEAESVLAAMVDGDGVEAVR